MKNRLWNPARLIDIGGLELKSLKARHSVTSWGLPSMQSESQQ